MTTIFMIEYVGFIYRLLQTKGMMVLMLEYWRSEKRCIRQKEMNIQSDGQKKSETGSQ
jgi:hypothetical protein